MNKRGSDFDERRFFGEFSRSRPRALLLDYDGTLAPFRVEREQAAPYPQIRDVLQQIVRAGRTRVVVITGRAIRDLIPLLGLEPVPEVWGCHGWERRLADGTYFPPQLERGVARVLAQAHEWACSAGLDGRCELKPAGTALHWRGMEAETVARLRVRVRSAWESFAGETSLEIHEFDGGLELRPTGRGKGFALAQMLRGLPDDTIVAYAGDDRTDEDAFRALSGRGLCILVRPEFRATAADLWLRPPDEWARFLNAWMTADKEGGPA